MRKLLLSLALVGSAFADLYIPCDGIKYACSKGEGIMSYKTSCACAEWSQIGFALLVLAAIVFVVWKYWFSKPVSVSKSKPGSKSKSKKK